MKIGQLIKNYREQHSISQRQFALLCNVSNGYISMLEEGRNPKTNEPIVPSLSTMKKIASAMGMSLNQLVSTVDDMDVLFDKEEIDLTSIPGIFIPKTKKLPVLGNIACGEPIFAEENFDGYIDIEEGIKADFCLHAKGDSMTGARIMDGDIVIVKKQDMVSNGEIAVVLIDNEATLKRAYYYPEKNMLILRPENPSYEDMTFMNDELNNIKILGKAVAFQSVIR